MESFVIPSLAGFAGNLLTEAVKSVKYLPSLLGDKGNQSDTLQNLEFSKNNDLVASKSYTCAFCEIMDALKDDRVNTIGVWGMGGVGKTTLVTSVGYTVKALQLFDKVIMVVVSQNPDIGKIQDKIADFLKLKFETKTQQGKAGELWDRLEKEEKVLIVLDDLWKEINLKEIGIPLGGNGKGCKIILTTRRKPVCESMARQVKVPVDVLDRARHVAVPLGVLDENDAWTLFKKKASIDEQKDNVDTINMAKEVAKECKGLPVAIVTLASALKGANTVEEWKIALKKLKSNRFMEIGNIEEEEKNAYMCLETSYEHLKKDTTKKLFLLCAVYPEDYSIDPEELVRSAWGLNIYGNATSIEEVRVDVFAAIQSLKDSCLLLEDTGKRSESPLTWDDYETYMYRTSYIKMHDVVRDVAQWIAYKEDTGFVAKLGVGLENEISKQKLEILILDNYDGSTPIDYFEGIGELKVLNLKASNQWNDVFSFKVLESLTNLRVLRMEGFKQLEGISALAKLTKLEILCLHYSSFQESVEKLGELTKLRVLEMHKCKFLFGFPPNLIRRLVKTEELYLCGSKIRNTSTAILSELHSLSKLASLSLEVPSLHFPQDFLFPRLQRYQIAINSSFWKKPPISSRFLKISEGGLNVILELFCDVEFLVVSNIEEKDIKWLTDTTPGNVALVARILQNLKLASIKRCKDLRVIFQMEKTENHALLLLKLKALHLKELPNLEYIWKMPTQHVRLQSLEAVHLYKCGKLKSVFSFSLAQCLIRLQLLEIVSCGELKQIVEEELEGDGREISGNKNPNKSLCLPKLRILKVENCKRLEYIFPNSMTSQGLPQLQKPSMEGLPQLKQICRPTMQRSQYCILLSQLQELLPSLTELTFRDCPRLNGAMVIPKVANLEGIQLSKLNDALFTNTENLSLKRIYDVHNLIPEVDREGLNKLTVLKFQNCSFFEYLIDRTKENVPNSTFTNLAELSLTHMHSLKMLCNGQFPRGFLQNLKELIVERCDELQELFKIDCSWEENRSQPLSNLDHYFSLQSLKVVNIFKCRKLKSLFSPSLFQSLLQLEELKIEDCAELKTLFAELESVGETEANSHLHPLCLPRLTTLNISFCERLEYVLPITLAQGLPQLESARVVECRQLKQVFGGVAKEHDGVEHCIMLPRLRDLQLCELTNLSSFGPQTYLVEVPALKELSVSTTRQLVKFTVHLEGVQLSKLRDALFTNTKNLSLYRICGDHNNLIPEVDREGLNKLTVLKFQNCSSFEYLIDRTKENVPNSAFTNLAELSLTHMDGLKMLCNGQFPKGFLQNLKQLTVERCDELQELFKIDASWEENRAQPLSILEHYFSLQGLKVVNIVRCGKLKSLFSPSLIQSLLQLEQLQIKDCVDLKTLFAELESVGGIESNSHLHPLCLPRLTTLNITCCERLEYVLPITLAQGLPQLERVKVGVCPQLKQVFGRVAKEHDGVEHCIKLPHLRDLQLYELAKMSSFCPENYLVKVPALKKLSVSSTPQLIKFTVQQVNNQWVHLEKNLIPTVDLDPEGLTSLKLRDCKGLECLADTTKELPPTTGMFTNLVKLVLRNMNDLKMLCNIGEPPKGFLQNLEVLEVEECMDIVSLYLMGQNIKKLIVKDCRKLQEVFLIDKLSKEENQAQLLSHLDSLWLMSLPQLRWILKGPTQYVSLQNLKVVMINECNKLESLFSASLIPSLRLLEELWMIGCDNLETVFLELESDGETKPNKLLASAQILPHLQKLHLCGLKNLSSFVPENYFIIVPALNDLEVVDCPRLTNFSIQQEKLLQSKLPDKDNSESSIETLKLGGLVWRHIPVVVLTNIQKLEVYDCNSLTYIFPMIHFRNLPQLWSLKIRRCENVEQIIGDDDMSASSSQRHDQLDETTAVKNEKQIVMFPELDELHLESLPSLVSFNPMGFHLIFPSLISLEIHSCPRMISSFTMDSISFVHAQTKAVKAPPLDGTTPSTPDITWRSYIPTSLPRYVEEADET